MARGTNRTHPGGFRQPPGKESPYWATILPTVETTEFGSP